MDLRRTILGGSSGEAHHTREEVVRQHVEDYDADAKVVDMLNDYHDAQ
jgi:hypothetical protein